MNKKIYEILAVCAVLLLGVLALKQNVKLSAADNGTPPAYVGAINASTTCGQLATGSITFGATSSTISVGTSTVFAISVNGTVATSSATATTTANLLANSFQTTLLAESSTLGIKVSTTTNGNTVQINMTSTVWGAPVTAVANPQLGITLSAVSGAASTRVVPPSSGRYYFSAANNGQFASNAVYLCKSTSCAIHTGYPFLSTSTAPFIQNGIDPYNGAYSCISATVSSSELDYISSQ